MTVRRRLRWPGPLAFFALVVLLALAVTAWVGLRGLSAQRHLEAARVQLETARTAAADQRLTEASTAVGAAAQDTARARELTGDVVWRLVGSVPYAGANVETARRLALNADVLVREVLPPALDALESADPASLRRPDGAIDLGLLETLTGPVVDGADQAREVRLDLERLPSAWVVGPIAQARDELTAQVQELSDTLDGASTAVRLAPPLLGADRPRRYVVLLQQNAESRGTGGLPGGYAVVEADGGRLRVVETASNADAPNGPVAVPDGVPANYVIRYGRLGAFDSWVNINASPDLPMVARVVAQRFEQQRQLPVDGVIALDAQALASILTGSEPLALPDGTTLAADQIVDYLGVRQYADFATATGADVSGNNAARKDNLSLIGAQAAARLTGGGGSSEALLRGLVEAVRSGHLRMASDDPALALLADAGVDGALPSTDRPVAYAVLQNSSGSKLDQFIDRGIRYTTDSCSGPTRSARIDVTLTNTAPEAGLPPYVTTRIGAGRAFSSSTEAVVTLNVYATAGAVLRRASVDGVVLDPADPAVPFLSRFVEGGLPAWAVRLDLPREQPTTLMLELDEPVLAGQPQVPQQPLARPLAVELQAPTC